MEQLLEVELKKFLEQLSGDSKDNNLIGQFGVGFYSFLWLQIMLKSLQKKALDSKAYKWKSDGEEGFNITDEKKKKMELKLYYILMIMGANMRTDGRLTI